MGLTCLNINIRLSVLKRIVGKIMNTKAQDTVHAKYYKQQIESGTKYKLQKEALEQLRENREYCDMVISTTSLTDKIDAVLKDMERRKREGDSFVKLIMSTKQLVDITASHRHYILEGYRNDIKLKA